MDNVLKNSTILVTGGGGFIGSALVEALLAAGNKVRCLDNFSTGHRNNISSFFGNPDFQLVDGDIRNPEDCHRAVAGVEIVFHEAALGSVPRSVKDPVTTNEVNINGMLNMLVASRDAGVRRMVYASSSSVYGDQQDLPKIEHITGNPLSPYAVTKKVNELYARVFGELYGLELIGLRYFNVFGRRQDPEGEYAAVIPRFVKALIAHKSPVIYGDGSQTRDFTYVDNVVNANLLAAVTNHPDAIGQAYNVACGERVSLNELFTALRYGLSQFDADIQHIEPEYAAPRAGDIPHSLASIRKISEMLGYKPEYLFARGLSESIQWYWQHLK